MKKSLILAVCLASASLVSCRKQDIRTVVISVPDMKNPACTKVILEAFMNQPAIKAVQPDIINRTVCITYDSMGTALKNLEFIIAAAGFDANDVSARPKAAAKLPAECREDEPEPPGENATFD